MGNGRLDDYLSISNAKNGAFKIISKESNGRYREIWKYLLMGSLEDRFELEFNKNFQWNDYRKPFFTDDFPRTEHNQIELLKSAGWRKNPYDMQHWGIWMHSLSPYQGRLTPSLAHWLIKIFSKKGDMVWDTFCGIGTVPFEAGLLKRIPIGTDLNPYAYLISSAKFNAGTLHDNLEYLRAIQDIDVHSISLDHVSTWIRDYYHNKTLKEILWITEKLKKDGKDFLLACLMGILHGHRPGYLSVCTGGIIPMKPRGKDHPHYRPDLDAKQYRAVLPRLAAKVMRMFQQPVPSKINGKILLADTRNTNFDNASVDVVISSPPYYDTLDYVTTNRVRLYFLDLDKDKQEVLKDELIQQKDSYLDSMLSVGKEIKRILKPNKYLVFVLGDVHYPSHSVNTAKEVEKIYSEIGFNPITIVNDAIPLNKTMSKTKKQKFDRILVMKN